MALIAEEHPKFLETPNPKLRLDFWTETFESVPFEIVTLAVKRTLRESTYVPKISDIVQRVKLIKQEIDARESEILKERQFLRYAYGLGVKLSPDRIEFAFGLEPGQLPDSVKALPAKQEE